MSNIEETAGTDIVIAGDTVAKAIESLKSGTGIYSTITGDSFEDRAKTMKAITSSKKIADNLGKVIKLNNFVVQEVDIANDKTGVMEKAARIILIDESGAAYDAVSSALVQSLRDIVSVLGEPSTWPSALPVTVIEEKSRRGFKFFTISLA